MTDTTAGEPQEGQASALRSYEVDKRDAYTRVAPVYDEHRFDNPAGRLLCEETNRTLLRLLEPTRGMRVLDVGAGTGRTALFLAEQGAEVCAYDMTPAMLDIARQRAAQKDLRNISFHIGVARQLPFQGGVFDAVICIRTLHLIPGGEHRSHLAEMWRVVRPGGVLIYELPNRCYGLLLRWWESLYRRFVLKRGPVASFRPSEAMARAAGLDGQRSLLGLLLPGSALLYRVSPRLARGLNGLGGCAPLNRLANLLWVVLRKGASPRGDAAVDDRP